MGSTNNSNQSLSFAVGLTNTNIPLSLPFKSATARSTGANCYRMPRNSVGEGISIQQQRIQQQQITTLSEHRPEPTSLVPKKYIHYHEFVKDKITKEHVLKILPSQDALRQDVVDDRIASIQKLKSDLRAFANSQVKKVYVKAAIDEGIDVRSFDELKRWWKDAEGTAPQVLFMEYIMYNMWSPNMFKALEESYMLTNNLAYEPDTVKASNNGNSGPGRAIYGCIRKTISYVKGDLTDKIRDIGKTSHGISIVKQRPKDECYDTHGKYLKNKDKSLIMVIYKVIVVFFFSDIFFWLTFLTLLNHCIVRVITDRKIYVTMATLKLTSIQTIK